ncbi:MAG TPA: hypothetical protein VF074_08950, partial [Pyrinomonadaceae bacterium]
MGPYITAYGKTFGEKAGRRFAIEWLSNFQGHLKEACLGQVSESSMAMPHTLREDVSHRHGALPSSCVR